MGFLTQEQLDNMGFMSLGRNVKISDKASIYAPEKISIGDNVRIDDFCILSAFGGRIKIGSHIHIAAFCNLIGRGGIEMMDFSGLSSRVSLYSCSDDYSGDFLIGPVMEEEFLNIISGPIVLERYVTIGTNSAVMPNVTLKEGSVLGAFSLLTKDTEEWQVYSGIRAKRMKARKKGLLEYAKKMEEKWKKNKLLPKN
jgi:acetyltransferase-like isoleucine patch superfamily enzyme